MGHATQEKQAHRMTGALIFAVLAAAFGSSFLFGYSMGVINAPGEIISQWIANISCEAAEAAINKSLPNPTASQLEQEVIWCNKIVYENGTVVWPSAKAELNSSLNTIMTLVTAIFCVGGLIGALSTSYFVDKFGRKGTMLWNNIISVAAVLLLSLPKEAGSYEMLIVGRFVVGISAGINSGVPATYLNEIAPAHLRGALGSLHQLSVTIAISVSQILGLSQIFGTADLWPLCFAFAAIPTLVQLAMLPFCPESPKYLYITKHDEQGARAALSKLRGTSDVDDEIAIMDVEREQMKREPPVKIMDLFTNSLLRKCTAIAALLMVCQQLSGINAVMFYSTRMFSTALSTPDVPQVETEKLAQYATIGMGGVNVLMTVISVFLVERAGRRTLLLIGFVGMTVVMMLMTASSLVVEILKTETWAAYVSVACIIVFVIFFATGPGSIPWFLVAEIFSQGPRAAATSIAVGTNWFCSLIVAVAFPLIQAAIGAYTFIIFAVILVGATAYIFFAIPETKGKTLEQVQDELQYGKHGRAHAMGHPTNKAALTTL